MFVLVFQHFFYNIVSDIKLIEYLSCQVIGVAKYGQKQMFCADELRLEYLGFEISDFQNFFRSACEGNLCETFYLVSGGAFRDLFDLRPECIQRYAELFEDTN